ncbi:MAG: hypothetical protein FD172_3212 [Methylocystaceae bacterium]|nr:MAG: hypothetical protein FD172_3212 [Methylocystaceae bacterium]
MTTTTIDHTVSIFDRIGGFDTVDRLVETFYRNMDELPEARGIRAVHADDLGPTRAILKVYLAEWLGGPKDYSAKKGHPRLRMRHGHLRIGPAERDAWMLCMNGALDCVKISRSWPIGCATIRIMRMTSAIERTAAYTSALAPEDMKRRWAELSATCRRRGRFVACR